MAYARLCQTARGTARGEKSAMRFRRNSDTPLMQMISGVSIVLATAAVIAAPPKRSARKPVTPPAVKNLPDLKKPEDKLRFLDMMRQAFPAIRSGQSAPLLPRHIDDLLQQQMAGATKTPMAPIVDDQTFLRRACLDLTGIAPSRQKIKEFLADTDPKKRENVVSELLGSDEYARKWARYWRSVVFHETNANRNTINPQAFEDWLFTEFQQGNPWDRIVAEMISASPTRVKDKKPQENGWQQNYGPNNFILACERKPEVIASQTARIFMGISVGCAECHDHPFDQWKREQFHEMAAFFAPGKYYMTDKDDPSQKTEMQARFLLGEEPPPGLKPDQRRVAGAAYLIYNPDNYWFARAFVNRVWSELIGDGFYSVDSLGPDKEVVYKLVVNRLAASFRSSGFDIRWLFRTIMATQAYQRESRTLDNDADLFTATRPARLRPYEVADNLARLVGNNGGLERSVRQAFDQNPSIPQRDLEGSIQQALLMMNNGQLQQLLAKSPLRKELGQLKDNRNLVREAFLGVLARTPTDAESQRYAAYVQSAANRGEAIDDLLWVLVNSAEFVTKK